MHEHGCALYGSTFSVASASDKTGAYANIFVADVTADSFLYRPAFGQKLVGAPLMQMLAQ